MKYSYELFCYHGISIKIHIAYIILIISAPLAFYLLFNIVTALAILQFILLLTFSILLHEFGQASYAKRFKVYFDEIILLPFSGIKVRKTMPKEAFAETRIALSGIAVYLAIVILMTPLIYSLYGFDDVLKTRIYDFSPFINFFQINLALLIFNIIPMYPMDSGRILRNYLTSKYDFTRATRIAKWLTYILAIMVIIVGLLFGLALIILAFFLYAGAQGKEKFDQAAKVLYISDEASKSAEREKYLARRHRVIKRTKQIRTKAEKVLGSTRVGFLARLWFKFRDYFHLEITKGRLNWAQEMVLSLLPKILHVKNIFKLWLQTKPIRKSIFFLLLASICLTLVWTLFLEYMILLNVGFFFCFGFGAFIIYYHTRSRKLMWFTILGCMFWLLYLALELFEPLLNLDYWGFLVYEGFRGCLVPLTGIMFFAVIINSNELFKSANTHMPLPAYVIISTLYLIGTFVLFYEIYLLSAYENDLDTIRFILRYDIAYLIWFFASASILISLIYLLYVGSISRYGRITTLKITTATIVIILLSSFFTRDLFFLALGRFSTRPDEIDLRVGLHSRNITKLDQDEFDNFFHLEVTWARVYSSDPGIADWSDYDWQIGYAMDHDIDIYLLVNPRAPGWFISDNPESVMRDQWNNTFYWIDEDPSKPSGRRVWDLSFNSEPVVSAKENFTREATERYHNYSCIKYISIQNEPIYPVDFNHNRLASYDPVTEVAFRDWMIELFDSDLSKLENETRLAINDWSELEPPRATTDRLWDEWRDFREESLTTFVSRLTHTVKNSTTKPVTVKIMGHFLSRYQVIQTGLSKRVIESFISNSDVVSLDLYPLTSADLKHSLDFYQKLARGKTIIIAEFNMLLGSNLPGSGSMFYYNLLIINRYAESVIVFTADDHYIYGINLYDHTPVHLGLRLFRLHREDGDVFSLYGELLWENLLSIPNYYEFYIFACTVWNIPVIPWPVLLLVMMPVPVAEETRRHRIKKMIYVAIVIILIISFIASNLPA